MPKSFGEALDRLRDQLNALYPNRSKASDGRLGDTKHAARKSEHNMDADGTVDAIDITHDPENGVDIAKLAVVLRTNKDKRLQRLIVNGEIMSGGSTEPDPWKMRPYTGANKHNKHIHVEVTDAGQHDANDWNLSGLVGDTNSPAVVTLKNGDSGDDVMKLQAALTKAGFVTKVDRRFGNATELQVRAFQTANGLKADGIVGKATWVKLSNKD